MAILKNTLINDTGYIQLPVGSTVQRIGSTLGEVRYNNITNNFEGYASTGWHVLSPMYLTITGVTIGVGVYTAAGTTYINPSTNAVLTISGFNFTNATSVSKVFLDSYDITSLATFNSPTQITVNTGTSLTSGTYSNVIVQNDSGQQATFAFPITVQNGPEFTTASNLGTITEGTISLSVTATSPGSSISGYSANSVSGNGGSGYGLPTGLTISSSGVISGNLVITGTTTYNITIKATDNNTPTPRTVSKDFTFILTDAANPTITAPSAGLISAMQASTQYGGGQSSTTAAPSSSTLTTFTASNPNSGLGASVYFRLSSGTLPQGVTLNSSTGVLAGTVVFQQKQAAVTTYNFGVTAVDSLNNASPEVQYSLTVAVPYLYRQALTTGYITGGYKGSSPWKNVNRLNMATEITYSLGDALTYAHNYKSGSCSVDKQYTFNVQSSGSDTAGQITDIFNMRTETGSTGPNCSVSRTRSGTVSGNDGNQTAAYLACGAASNVIEKYQYSTDSFVTFTTTLPFSTGYEATYCSDELFGIWSIGGAGGISYTKKLTYSTEGLSDFGISLNSSTQQKQLQTKYGFVYAGTGTGYGDNDPATIDNSGMTKTVFSNQTQFTVPKGYSGNNTGNVGEEIMIMGQDRGWAIGVYDTVQNNSGYRMVYAIDVSVTIGGSTTRKGTTGSSSGTGGWRD
jgi:hypothetical protein